eukprot:gene8893-10537_t
MQQFSNVSGKSCSDSALIIDAMDILHCGNVEGMALMSSDSDFTRLAARLREGGLVVFGVGNINTPLPFVAACDRFITTDTLIHNNDSSITDREVKHVPRELLRTLIAAVNSCEDDNGWASVSSIKEMLLNIDPSFDERRYHFQTISDLLRAEFPTARFSGPPHIAIKLDDTTC